MAVRNSRTAGNPHVATRAKSARGKVSGAKARAGQPASRIMAKPVQQAFAASHDYALAGLGLVSRLRKEREARMAELVAEGKRVESKIQQALEGYKDTVRSRIDAGKATLPKLRLAMPRLDLGKLRRLGTPTARP